MKLVDELINFLDLAINEKETKYRDIEIILTYFGFRDLDWNTYIKLAEKFNLGSRQRSEQIINEFFRDITTPHSFPSLKQAAEILEESYVIPFSEYGKKLISANLIEDEVSVIGLIKLMHELDLCKNYQTYTPKLKPITISTFDKYNEGYLIEESKLEGFREKFKILLTLPGQLGIANFEYFKGEVGNLTIDEEIAFKSLIVNSSASWISNNEEYWYLIENRQNKLVNFSGKVFKIIEVSDPTHLAEVYDNALYNRTNKYSYPPKKIIEEFLKESLLFELDGNNLKFIGKKIELNDIEKAAVGYLKDKENVAYPEFKQYLIDGGFKEDYVSKTISNSPLIRVDKSLGHGNYKYSLVGGEIIKGGLDPLTERYNLYKQRLRNFADVGTDIPIENKRRREHPTLVDWLFKDKDFLECAICQELFHKSVLVTAHKKPRFKCSDTERLDPNIVMPLCLLGCEFLYDNEFIYVDGGVVKVNPAKTANGKLQLLINSLERKKIKKEWLYGGEKFFYKP